jgi:CheY-like chemotaxis protein
MQVLNSSMSCLLIVDDDSYNLEIIAEFLSDQTYELVFAHDGQEALTQLAAHPERFDAIILDRMMPNMDGMEVLKHIRAQDQFADMPAIMQTASNSPEEVAEGLAAGAWYYLAKPYDAQALTSVVRGALHDRHNRQELARLSAERYGFLKLLDQASFRFRNLKEARLLAAMFGQMHDQYGTLLSMGLSELLVNAIEHGNLAMGYAEKTRLLDLGTWDEEIERRLATPEQQQRWAELEFTRKNEKTLQFIVRDQGQGFDWQNYLKMDPSRAFDSHGRGIALAHQLAFQTLNYQGHGNIVQAIICFDELV